MHGKSQNSKNKLFEIAESQQGYFTSEQAKASGYKDNTHPYQVRSGHWVRVHRGILIALLNFLGLSVPI